MGRWAAMRRRLRHRCAHEWPPCRQPLLCGLGRLDCLRHRFRRHLDRHLRRLLSLNRLECRCLHGRRISWRGRLPFLIDRHVGRRACRLVCSIGGPCARRSFVDCCHRRARRGRLSLQVQALRRRTISTGRMYRAHLLRGATPRTGRAVEALRELGHHTLARLRQRAPTRRIAVGVKPGRTRRRQVRSGAVCTHRLRVPLPRVRQPQRHGCGGGDGARRCGRCRCRGHCG